MRIGFFFFFERGESRKGMHLTSSRGLAVPLAQWLQRRHLKTLWMPVLNSLSNGAWDRDGLEFSKQFANIDDPPLQPKLEILPVLYM